MKRNYDKISVVIVTHFKDIMSLFYENLPIDKLG